MKPEEYLNHLLSFHDMDEIRLGLDRVSKVLNNLTDGARSPQTPFVYTVGGTNGKGTCCAMLEQGLRSHGLKTGLISSPHLLSFNERICINGQPASDEEWLVALKTVNAHTKKTPLTYFEYCTLAAFIIFWHHNLDVWILEVGLGGRLDAVNILDADCAIITSISLDHTQILGDNRESIAYEKLQIARAGKPLVFGDRNPPSNLDALVQDIGASLFMIERDFKEPNFVLNNLQLLPDNIAVSWQALKLYKPLGTRLLDEIKHNYANLDKKDTLAQNPDREKPPASTVKFDDDFKIDPTITATAWNNFFLAGRWHKIEFNNSLLIMDTGHNPAAAVLIAKRLKNEASILSNQPTNSGTANEVNEIEAIFAILATKDWQEFIKPLLPLVSKWHLFPLKNSKALPPDEIALYLKSLANYSVSVQQHKDASAVLAYLYKDQDNVMPRGKINSKKEGRGQALKLAQYSTYLVCGSFHTVGEIIKLINPQKKNFHSPVG